MSTCWRKDLRVRDQLLGHKSLLNNVVSSGVNIDTRSSVFSYTGNHVNVSLMVPWNDFWAFRGIVIMVMSFYRLYLSHVFLKQLSFDTLIHLALKRFLWKENHATTGLHAEESTLEAQQRLYWDSNFDFGITIPLWLVLSMLSDWSWIRCFSL